MGRLKTVATAKTEECNTSPLITQFYLQKGHNRGTDEHRSKGKVKDAEQNQNREKFQRLSYVSHIFK